MTIKAQTDCPKCELAPDERKAIMIDAGERASARASELVQAAGGNVFDYFDVLGQLGRKIGGLAR